MKTKILFIFFITVFLSCVKKKEEKMNMTAEEHADMDKFKFSEAQLKLANIKVESIEMKNISEEIVLTGTVVENENKSVQINSRIMGRIDQLYFKFTGSTVRKGDLLYEIYSEELLAAQKDYLFAVQEAISKSNNDGYLNQLKESAKNKLLLWGLTEPQLAEMEKTKEINFTTKVYSNENGIITDVLVREGDYVTEGATVFKLNDLSSLWIEAQLYSNELQSVKKNTEVEVKIDGFNNQRINANISFINPELNNNSIVNLIRAEITNTDFKFKPGMLATIRIKVKLKNTLVLPMDAVLVEADGSSVWTQKADGSFEVRMVKTGIRNNNEIEITTGLKEGEKVVVGGAYLMNCEFKLKRDADPMGGMKM